jgi:hypothetical protein
MRLKPSRTFVNGRVRVAKFDRGFALVITLSLMVLLTVVAVGLLTLSAVQLRSTGLGQSMAEARANARLSLMLALGDLQRTMGPDGRVSVTAEQSLPEAVAETSPHRQWTGVYEAWNADQGLAVRPQPKFVRWLTSAAKPDAARQRSFADSGEAGEIAMVGGGTLGARNNAAAGAVTSPALAVAGGQQPGKLAWWVADESMKAHVVSGSVRPAFAAASNAEPLFAANAGITANSAGLPALGEIRTDDPQRSKYLSAAQLELKNPDAGSLFHDVTAFSRGLPVDVTRGRFKFDFSSFALLDRRQVGNLPLYKADGAVNRFASSATAGLANDSKFSLFNGGAAAMLNVFGDTARQPGIHLEELWTHANLYRNLTWTSGVPSLRLMNGSESSSTDFRHRALADPWFSYKKPVFAAVQFVFSFVSKPDPAVAGKFRMLLQMDALVKVWNPNNVRVEIPAGASFVVQLLSVPFKVQWSITTPQGAPVTLAQSGIGDNTYSFARGNWPSSGNKFGQASFQWLRGNLGGLAQKGVSTGYTLEPGECKIFGHDKETSSADWRGDPNVNLSPGWGPGRQALIVADFGANGLGPDDTVEFVVSPDKDPNPSNVRTYCNKWIGHRAPGAQNQGGNGGLALGGNSLPTSIDFSQPDPAWFPPIRSSQRLKVAQFGTPKPFMIFGHYMNVEQSSAGTRDAFANSPRLLTNPAITTRRLRSFEPDQLSAFQEVWRCDPLPMAYDSVLIDISAKDQGRFGGGHSALTGVTRCATRQLDAAPPLSLMSLSHAIANGFADRFGQAAERGGKGLDVLQSDGLGGNYKFEPGDIAFSTVTYAAPQVDRAIGNSFASPFIRTNKVTGSGAYHAANGNLPLFDHSYLANAALFDAWFCSSLHDGRKFPAGAPYGDSRNAPSVLAEFFDQSPADPAKRLINPRVIPASSPALAKERLLKGQAMHPEAIARLGAHVFLDGSFNVNSTRKEAWQALLSSARDQAKLLNGNPVSNSGKTPFGSSGLVSAAAAEPAANPTELAQWCGYRELDDERIADLAEEVVKEVKARGPFLSLADFINRRPGDSGATRLLGTVQAAIEAAGLNDSLKGGGRGVSAADFAKLPAPDAASAGGGLARSTGIPGYLMQSDVLASVANQLTARGDSFRIRGYGAATDAAGRVIAEAWCEAIVQRVPEYLDAAEAAETEFAGLTRPVNRTFGRRFQIIAFQWLPRQAV